MVDYPDDPPPRSRIVVLEARQNAIAQHRRECPVLLGDAQPERGVRILLVTSATHMPRAAAMFRKTGFESIPAAAGYGGSAPWLFVWMPDAEALSNSSRAIKEWLELPFWQEGPSGE